MSIKGEEIKPLSELLPPEKLEEMLNNCIHEIEVLREVYRLDVKYYMDEYKKLIDLKNEVQKILDSPITDFDELHSAIKGRIESYHSPAKG